MLNKELQLFLEDFFAASELNRLPKNYGGGPCVDKNPVIAKKEIQ